MRRSNLLVLLGIAFFVIGGVIVYLLTSEDDDAAAGEAAPVPVVVGTDDIPAGALGSDLVEQGKVTVVEVASTQLVAGAVQSLNQLEGATFTQGFAEEQQITTAGIQGQNRNFEIPEGFEAVAVQLDFVAGAAGYADTGDHLNLYGVIKTPSGGLPTPRAELLLTNVEVLDVDRTVPPRRGTATQTENASTTARPGGDNLTYLVALRTADVEKVIYATEFESLYASLTHDEAAPAGPTSGRDGVTILAEEPNAAAR